MDQARSLIGEKDRHGRFPGWQWGMDPRMKAMTVKRKAGGQGDKENGFRSSLPLT